MNIYFCGMIGSGKTSIGIKLAKSMGLEFYDLDREMDTILGYSFHKLVEEKGWLSFRELEYSICKKFASYNNAVIALGGGTVRYQWNVDILKDTGVIILFETSLKELAQRVRAADRPRVNPGVSLEEDLEEIWDNSREKYYSAADLVYRTECKTIEQEVQELEEIAASYLRQ